MIMQYELKTWKKPGSIVLFFGIADLNFFFNFEIIYIHMYIEITSFFTVGVKLTLVIIDDTKLTINYQDVSAIIRLTRLLNFEHEHI